MWTKALGPHDSDEEVFVLSDSDELGEEEDDHKMHKISDDVSAVVGHLLMDGKHQTKMGKLSTSHQTMQLQLVGCLVIEGPWTWSPSTCNHQIMLKVTSVSPTSPVHQSQ